MQIGLVIAVSVAVSAVVSAVVAGVNGYYHFKIIDSYVENVVEIAKKEVKRAFDVQGKR